MSFFVNITRAPTLSESVSGERQPRFKARTSFSGPRLSIANAFVSPNRRKKVQKHRVFLTMLFGEIAYEWVECLPCGRQKGEPFLLRISRERFLRFFIRF